MTTPSFGRRLAAIIALATVACQSRLFAQTAPQPDPVRGHLPAVPAVRGPLRLTVVHPAVDEVLDIADSTFVFGSAGTGNAIVHVAGQLVRVTPNGAWLGWVKIPAGASSELVVEARSGTDSARLVMPLRRLRTFAAPATGAWIDTTSFVPRGRLWLAADAEVPLGVRAAPGSRVSLRLPNGTRIPLPLAGEAPSRAEGVLAFDRDSARRQVRIADDRFAGVLPVQPIGRHPGTVFGDTAVAADAGPAVLEAALGSDTARAIWPVRVAVLDAATQGVRLDDDPTGSGTTDSITVGRAVRGGSYHWFFGTGTRAALAGRHDGDLLLQLSSRQQAWVSAADVQPLARGLPRPSAVLGSMVLRPEKDRVVLRVPWTAQVPVQIEEADDGLHVTFHAAHGDVDWIRYGGADPLVRRISWQQRSTDLVELTIELSQPLWGWRGRSAPGDFVLELRRPPVLDPRRPFAGRTIVVDPGHPPLGATGPTGLREAEANLAIALRLAPMLRRAGAKVLMTRVTDTAVALGDRVPFAERAEADLLLSIHNNALPDGVEPFGNSGTSVFYNRLPGLALAMRVQESLARSLGVRALGVAQGDLALVRGTWVPSMLSEGLFLMIPEQEAALRSAAGQQLYARGVFAGVEQFLREMARRQHAASMP